MKRNASCRLLRSICLIAPLLGAGCAHVYKMKLEAEARPDALAHISYAVRDLSPGVELEKETATSAANCVRTALSAKGMYESPATLPADVDVAFTFDIKTQRSTRKTSEPEYSTAPDGGIRTNYSDKWTEVVAYQKTLHLVATEKKSTRPDGELRVWDITVTYEDADPDLPKAMPLLAAAVCDRIGSNTDGPVIVRLRDKDEVVAFIKRGL